MPTMEAIANIRNIRDFKAQMASVSLQRREQYVHRLSVETHDETFAFTFVVMIFISKDRSVVVMEIQEDKYCAFTNFELPSTIQ